MADIRDAEESILLGSSTVETWRAEFLENWMAPLKRMMVSMMLQSMNPQQHHALKQLSGDDYDRMMKEWNIRGETNERQSV